jgi:alanine racemase
MAARTALAAGASRLAVATVQEGILLRRSGITAPILVLGPVAIAELPDALVADLELAVAELAQIESVAQAATCLSSETRAGLHLKIDTGMRRYGCRPDHAVVLAAAIARHPALDLSGVFTHFAAADDPDEHYTIDQVAQFDAALDELASAGFHGFLRHAANTAATLRSARYHYDAVRLGIGMYGISPSPQSMLLPGMVPAMSVVSHVGRVFSLEPGDRVSYGGTYIAKEAECAALVPIGYADGYRRIFSNRGWMSFNGSVAAVLGRVSMDQTVVAIAETQTAKIGDKIVVVGNSDAGSPRWEDLAEWADTIPYEVLSTISPRVPRVYRRGGNVVAIEDLGGLRSIE